MLPTHSSSHPVEGQAFGQDDCNCMEIKKMSTHTGLEILTLRQEKPQWFVLRDLKRANALEPAYKLLEGLHFQVFTPFEQRISVKKGKRVAVLVPVIPSLLFAYTKKSQLDPVVKKYSTLQYRYVKGGGYCSPMTVPEQEMTRFVEAVQKTANVRYFKPEEITSNMEGKQIRVIGGLLNGYTGKLITKRGSKFKSLQLEITGVICAHFDLTGMDYVEICDSSESVPEKECL